MKDQSPDDWHPIGSPVAPLLSSRLDNATERPADWPSAVAPISVFVLLAQCVASLQNLPNFPSAPGALLEDSRHEAALALICSLDANNPSLFATEFPFVPSCRRCRMPTVIAAAKMRWGRPYVLVRLVGCDTSRDTWKPALKPMDNLTNCEAAIAFELASGRPLPCPAPPPPAVAAPLPIPPAGFTINAAPTGDLSLAVRSSWGGHCSIGGRHGPADHCIYIGPTGLRVNI